MAWRYLSLLMLLGPAIVQAQVLKCDPKPVAHRFTIEEKVQQAFEPLWQGQPDPKELQAALAPQLQRLFALYREKRDLHLMGVVLHYACYRIKHDEEIEKAQQIPRFQAVRKQVVDSFVAKLANPPPDMIAPYGDKPELPRSCAERDPIDQRERQALYRIDANGPPYDDATITWCQRPKKKGKAR